ncbi:MAG: hypothetical protein ACN6O3_04935 [Comamonas sp.]
MKKVWWLLWCWCSLVAAAWAAPSRPVMEADASPEQVAQMVQEAAKPGTPAFKTTFGYGSFQASPGEGYRSSFTVRGERTAHHQGPAKVLLIATVGDESGGRVLQCSAEDKQPRIGDLSLRCEAGGAFHVEDSKEVVVRFGLGLAENLSVTAVAAEVATGGARSGMWLFSRLIPLLIGLLMLGYWFFFLRR